MKKSVSGMTLGGRVDIIDVSVDSLGIEHAFPMQLGTTTFVEFSWGRDLMELPCVVARTSPIPDRPGHYRSGLKILRKGISEPVFRKRVKEAIEKLKEIEANRPSEF